MNVHGCDLLKAKDLIVVVEKIGVQNVNPCGKDYLRYRSLECRAITALKKTIGRRIRRS